MQRQQYKQTGCDGGNVAVAQSAVWDLCEHVCGVGKEGSRENNNNTWGHREPDILGSLIELSPPHLQWQRK